MPFIESYITETQNSSNQTPWAGQVRGLRISPQGPWVGVWWDGKTGIYRNLSITLDIPAKTGIIVESGGGPGPQTWICQMLGTDKQGREILEGDEQGGGYHITAALYMVQPTAGFIKTKDATLSDSEISDLTNWTFFTVKNLRATNMYYKDSTVTGSLEISYVFFNNDKSAVIPFAATVDDETPIPIEDGIVALIRVWIDGQKLWIGCGLKSPVYVDPKTFKTSLDLPS